MVFPAFILLNTLTRPILLLIFFFHSLHLTALIIITTLTYTTDDSKTNNLVGCGIVCRNTILSFHQPVFYSVFSAEFLAIKTVLKLISSYFHRRFVIYSDSKSVLDSLQTHALILSSQFYKSMMNFAIRVLVFYLVGF